MPVTLADGSKLALGVDGDRYVVHRPDGVIVVGHRSGIRVLRRRMLAQLVADAKERAEVKAALSLAEEIEP